MTKSKAKKSEKLAAPEDNPNTVLFIAALLSNPSVIKARATPEQIKLICSEVVDMANEVTSCLEDSGIIGIDE